MTSTPQQRLLEVTASYSAAYQRRAQDLAEAQTIDQATAILANVNTLETAYLDAARAALDGNGAAIEQAYRDAVDARAAVDDGYAAATDIATKIKLVGSEAEKVGDLVKLATAKPADADADADANE